MPNDIRLKQIVDGITEFFKYNHKYLDDGRMSVYITDNSISEEHPLDSTVIAALHPKCKIITNNQNVYGKYNKGAGLIDQWRYCESMENVMSSHEWFIHFEPRLFLQNNDFIDSFMSNPRELFTINQNNVHFNTGLFATRSNNIIEFMNHIPLQWMISHQKSLEDLIYVHYNKNYISFDCFDKMNVIWYNANGIEYHM